MKETYGRTSRVNTKQLEPMNKQTMPEDGQKGTPSRNASGGEATKSLLSEHDSFTNQLARFKVNPTIDFTSIFIRDQWNPSFDPLDGPNNPSICSIDGL